MLLGAFPGLSNVMAVEASEMLGEQVETLEFSYFTAGGPWPCEDLPTDSLHAMLSRPEKQVQSRSRRA